MSMSNFLEQEFLDHVFGGAAYTGPTTVYISLHTANPDEDASGAEVSGGSYARVLKTANSTNFPSTNPMLCATVSTFPEATASWGTVTHFAIWDAATTGNMLVYGALTSSQAVVSGNTVSIPANEISITAQ